jgi:hypothetical protein
MESIAWRAAFIRLSHPDNKKSVSTDDIDNNSGSGNPDASLRSRLIS